MADSSTLTIGSSRLSVEIARPRLVYTGSRFDWTGFVTQVTLDGKHTFCVPEDYDFNKGSGGIGLCNEFGIEAPVGYDDCLPGDTFPKLGIGLLIRPDEGPYRFFHAHKIARLFPIQIETVPDCVTFTVEPVETRGYAARLVKRLCVRDNQLEITSTLENCGERPIDTHEYYHNFIGVDDQLLGPDYVLRLAGPIRQQDMTRQYRSMAPAAMRLLPPFVLDWLIRRMMGGGNRVLRISGNEVRFAGRPGAPFYLRLVDQPKSAGPQWELEYLPAGLKMREFDDFTPLRAAVWGTTHVVSAEIFIDLHLQPGETTTWTRRFEFI